MAEKSKNRPDAKKVDTKTLKKELIALMMPLTTELLKLIHRHLMNTPDTGMRKNDLVQALAESLAFQTREDFEEWFDDLPVITREILRKGAYEHFVFLGPLEKELGASIVKLSTDWRPEWYFLPELRIGYFGIYTHGGQAITAVPWFIRKILCLWLPPPPHASIENCHAETGDIQDAPWDNSVAIADTFPLLCDALGEILDTIAKEDRDKTIRAGFKKKRTDDLHASTGIPAFSLEPGLTPDSVELIGRFVLCMTGFKPERPADAQKEVRQLVNSFFNEKAEEKYSSNPEYSYFEYNVCLDHLSKPTGKYYPNYRDETPPHSRQALRNLLIALAKDGGVFDADKLSEYIRINVDNFIFCSQEREGKLFIKANALQFDGLVYAEKYISEFRPVGVLRHHLLVKPLFKAYCYLFATLGLLEITTQTPPPSRFLSSKGVALSYYDSLKTIRVTEFGRWCLGLSSERPPRPVQNYKAIADKELFLVTVKGESLERTIYLDKIGVRLGEERWRISPGSFIVGCNNLRQIEDRIERFKQLIDPVPAPHWEALFKKVLDRAGVFDKIVDDVLVYVLPEDREFAEELLRDPEIKGIVLRAEGRMLLVRLKNQEAFYRLLRGHGCTRTNKPV